MGFTFLGIITTTAQVSTTVAVTPTPKPKSVPPFILTTPIAVELLTTNVKPLVLALLAVNQV